MLPNLPCAHFEKHRTPLQIVKLLKRIAKTLQIIHAVSKPIAAVVVLIDAITYDYRRPAGDGVQTLTCSRW
jgi:hypothetical protein